MRIHDEIATLIALEPHGTPEAIASRVIDRVTKADLIPLIAAEVAHAQRAQARGTERAAFRETFAASTSKPPRAVPEGLRSLFATPFRLGDGSEVNWLTATVDDHRQRIDHLSKIREGLDRTIDQHREAIAIIESAGARCLADVTEVRVAA